MKLSANHGTAQEKRLLYRSMEAHYVAPSLQSGVGEHLEGLGGITRTKESTIGAVKDIFQGTGRLVFVRGKRLKGASQVAEGVFNIFDIVPSAIADGVRSAAGPKGKGGSDYNYNISRAFGSFKDVKKPTDVIGATVDVIHAVGFRLGTDAVRAVGGTTSATRAQVSRTLAA